MSSQNNEGLAPAWFTPKGQKGEESEKRSYQWRPMDGWECIDIAGEFVGNKLTPEGIRTALKNGLIAWKNIKNKANGEMVDFSFGDIGHAPTDDLIELAWQIVENSNLTAEEEKN